MSRAAVAPTLYESVSALDRHFGGAFVYAPQRWGTADGTIAYKALYPALSMMRRQLAAERLHLARAAWFAGSSGDARDRAVREDQRVADGTAE